jgi:hypothetical protein
MTRLLFTVSLLSLLPTLAYGDPGAPTPAQAQPTLQSKLEQIIGSLIVNMNSMSLNLDQCKAEAEALRTKYEPPKHEPPKLPEPPK